MDDIKINHLDTVEYIPFSELKKLLLDTYFEPVQKSVERQKLLLRNTEKVYKSYYDRLNRIDSSNEYSKYINESSWLNNSIYELLENEFPEIDLNTCEEVFASFHREAELYLEELPEYVMAVQSEKRFLGQQEDSLGLRLKKKLKNTFFHATKLPLYFVNLFRSEKIKIKRWNHKIPIRSINRHFFLNQFFSECLPFYEELQSLKCEALNIKWAIDKEINLEVDLLLKNNDYPIEELLVHIKTIAEKNRIQNFILEFDQKLKKWEEKSHQILKEVHQRYEEALEKVGTIELKSHSFSGAKLSYEHQEYSRQFLKIHNGWRNTLYAQIDDFQTDIELYQVKYISLLQFSLLQKSYRARLDKTFTNYFGKIEGELQQIILPIEAKEKNEHLIDQLQIERKKLHRKLERQLIPQTIEAIYNQNLSNLLERLEIRIGEQIGKMKSQRIIYAKNTYNSPITKAELNHFNPKKLVEIDLFNRFKERLKTLKKEIVVVLEQAEVNLTDLVGIVDYNLDAAINSAQENQEENKDESSVHKITLEGIERTISKTENIKDELNQIDQILKENLKKAIDEMNQGLIKLTNNENITDLRIQLAKAKAKEKSTNYRRFIIVKFKSIAPLLIRFFRRKYNLISTNLATYGKKIGLFEKEEELSAELSDFLIQTDLAIGRLPYVYRRLYQIKPTEEEVFFEGRKESIKALKEAFANWRGDNYSSSVIIGEKGSGGSSLINFFLKEINHKKQLRKKLNRTYSSQHDFIEFFKTLLDKSDINTFEELAEYLNQEEPQLIVLEDVQHFFLKKIHGFEALNLLFELISQTEKNVFWLLEFTSYAWRYLEKTVSIGRYFKYKVELQTMSKDQIINIIMRRHRVSGYDIVFDQSSFSKVDRRKLNLLKESEQEGYLKQLYFKELCNFAQSNISLAMLYWLRSAVKVEENTIFIGQIEEVNFDFLKTLSKESIFTLHALIIHDSLNVEEHALIFNQSIIQSRLNLMVLEDQGILRSSDSRYQINRLLYRQVVTDLTKKNILH